MFTRESLLESDWYKERLCVKQKRDIALWTRHVEATGTEAASKRLAQVSSANYLEELAGTIGADPFTLQVGQLSDRS
jgi:hypothetical protein